MLRYIGKFMLQATVIEAYLYFVIVDLLHTASYVDSYFGGSCIDLNSFPTTVQITAIVRLSEEQKMHEMRLKFGAL